jgi:outer membrane protein insertion porin family
VALFLAPISLHAQQELVESIEIHGNRRIPAETIRAHLFTRAGDVYDPAALERDFNSLWNTNYFDDLRFERERSAKGWRIHVYVKEKPTIREINYVGLNSVSQSDVLDRFKDRKVGLSVESQYDPTRVKKAEVTIKDLLAEHGHQFATIKSEVRPIPPAAVAVTFVVKEGPKVKVGRIRFEGNRRLKTRQLRSAMKNLKPIGVPHSIFLENIFARTYDATKLNEDAERVRYEYQQQGYFKALVQDPKTRVRDTHGLHIPLFQHGGGKAVDITIPIEEGDRYRLGAITFKNNKAVRDPRALRSLFAMKDGDIFNAELVRKGLENLRKAYGELGYINFTSVPDTQIDEARKLINLAIDIDEGKPFFVRRIEFQGNTTTRDKVIRRELAIEEGQVYNTRLWELSLLRLNQLDYFEQLKPEEATERKLNEGEGTVDLTLKVKEKGKNSIQLTGGVSGLAGSFIGLSYTTNNFLGLGETLQVQASIGNLTRQIMFGFTEPYLFDRPIQAGFTVYNTRLNYNQAKQEQILIGQQLNLSQNVLNNLQNFTQNSTGFTVSSSYQLHRSFKRIGITYTLDRSTIQTFSNASTQLFENLAFRGVAGPTALNGIVTSKVLPNFSFNRIDNPMPPHSGQSLFMGLEFAGLGGTVRSVRPIVQYKRFTPIGKRGNTLGFNFQGSFLSGFGGLVAPPFERFYAGGENDLRGFDIRSISPIAFLPDVARITLTNPDGTAVPRDPSNPRLGNVIVPVPVQRIVFPGGDTSLISNVEYRIPIVGPVTLAPFTDFGFDGIARLSQLRINSGQLSDINNTAFGCPVLNFASNCTGGQTMTFSGNLKPLSGTNFVPRMSSGLELQVILPVVNAPFRIYYAYNPLRLDTFSAAPTPITRGMFPAGAAGDYTFQQAIAGAIGGLGFAPAYQLREPRKTFRFTVSTTF